MYTPSLEKYIDVIEKCDTYIIDFQGEPIVTKFEFLKALAIARVYGFKEYEKALTFIKLNYSSTIEGKEAERILDQVFDTRHPWYRSVISKCTSWVPS